MRFIALLLLIALIPPPLPSVGAQATIEAGRLIVTWQPQPSQAIVAVERIGARTALVCVTTTGGVCRQTGSLDTNLRMVVGDQVQVSVWSATHLIAQQVVTVEPTRRMWLPVVNTEP